MRVNFQGQVNRLIGTVAAGSAMVSHYRGKFANGGGAVQQPSTTGNAHMQQEGQKQVQQKEQFDQYKSSLLTDPAKVQEAWRNR